MNFDTSDLFEGHAAGGGNGEGPLAGEPAHKLVKRGTLKDSNRHQRGVCTVCFHKGGKKARTSYKCPACNKNYHPECFFENHTSAKKE